MHKSNHKIQKTSKSLHVEPEMDEDELPLTKQVTPAPNDDDIYFNEEEERALMLREEEEESDRNGEDIEKDQRGNEEEEEDSDKPETIQVVPQKGKKGKDMKKSTSKSYMLFLPL
jgi:glutamyl/glutaminyl-tRNA synthetase